MSLWFTIMLLFLLFICVEETIYFTWNRYLFGKNNNRKRKWGNGVIRVMTFLKRRKPLKIKQSNKEKSSQ